jgi:hypothetical protein
VLGAFLYTVDVRLPFLANAVLLGVGALALLTVNLVPSGPVAPEPRMPAQALSVTAGEPESREELVADASLEAAVEPAFGHAAAAPVARRPGLRDALEGLRLVRRNPVLLGAISLDLFAVLFGGAVALLPAIAKDRLGVGALGLGWLRAAGGIGAGLVTLVLAVRPLRRHVGPVLLGAVAVFGVWTIVLGLTTSFAIAFIAMLVLSGADAVSVFIRATLVPLATPEATRGRVMAVENVFIGASNELGAFESGVAGEILGTAGAVALGGAVTLVVAGGWWVLFPALRGVDRFPEGGDSGGDGMTG